MLIGEQELGNKYKMDYIDIWIIMHYNGFHRYLDYNKGGALSVIVIVVGNGSFWLVGFYGISTFEGYLTPNPFLCK